MTEIYRNTVQVSHNQKKTIKMNQKTAFNSSFRMQCIIDWDVNISSWNKEEKWDQSKTNLSHSDEDRWKINSLNAINVWHSKVQIHR